MALTINPAVSRVSYGRWTMHVVFFALGVGSGALVTYAVARALYVGVAAVSETAWLAIALSLIGLAVLRDLGLHAPVPYPARKQVPEWLRRTLPPGPTAIAYGSQLGVGFLTRFTYSTHTAFAALLAMQTSPVVVAAAVTAFALSKCVGIVSSPFGKSYPEFEDRLLHLYRLRGQTALRLANASLAVAAAVALLSK